MRKSNNCRFLIIYFKDEIILREHLSNAFDVIF